MNATTTWMPPEQPGPPPPPQHHHHHHPPPHEIVIAGQVHLSQQFAKLAEKIDELMKLQSSKLE